MNPITVIRDLLQVHTGPRVCDECGLVTDRVANWQFDRWTESGGADLPCVCGGRLESALEKAMRAEAAGFEPSPDALERIRARAAVRQNRPLRRVRRCLSHLFASALRRQA